MRIEVNSQEIARLQLGKVRNPDRHNSPEGLPTFQKMKHEIKKQLKAISRNRHE